MSREFYLVANWKMHFTPEEAKSLYQEFQGIPANNETKNRVHLWVSTPAVSLTSLQGVKSEKVRYGSQNVHFEEKGAFTGEISVPMVKACGGDFTLVGHSERRQIFKESEELLVQRTEGALTQGLDVIYCVGETLEERESGDTVSVLENQLSPILRFFESYEQNLIIAYEPVWAIGTGKVATVEEVQSAHQEIKSFVNKAHSSITPRVLYGGSVKPENVGEIGALNVVDGALVGGASLKAESFGGLYQVLSKI